MTKDEYLALITSEHSEKPRFSQTVGLSVSPLASTQDALRSLVTALDIDLAVGKQLDMIGEWIGESRRIPIPLVGVYFAWDDTITNGFDAGVWKGIFDPESGLVDLPDSSYRTLLRARISANSWDGSIPDASKIWESAFGNETFLLIQDHQDMTMTIGIAGTPLSTIDKALLVNGILQLKPEGVRVDYYAIAPAYGSLFGWDVAEGSAMAGFDSGQWAEELMPV